MEARSNLKMPYPSIERRRNPRYLCSHLLEVTRGNTFLCGLLEDLSAEGASVSVEIPLRDGEIVKLAASGFHAQARVRHCQPRESGFVAGMEFAGYRWEPRGWRPDHLYLPAAKTQP